MKMEHGIPLRRCTLLIAAMTVALLSSETALRAVGREPLPTSPERPQFWEYHPLLGWANKPGERGVLETLQFRTLVQINHQGLRDGEHTYERRNDARRILILGDSFAWGFGVDQRDCFSQQLEASKGIEVINAAVPGYSTDQELLWLEEEGIRYDADLVILTFCGNDVWDNHRQRNYFISNKPRFTLKKGVLPLGGVPVHHEGVCTRVLRFLQQHSALLHLLISGYTKIQLMLSATRPASVRQNASTPFELTRAVLRKIRETSESTGARFMIVATKRYWLPVPDGTYTDFMALLRSDGFRVLDIESVKGFSEEEMIIAEDGHWNSAGHTFVAQGIKEYIMRRHLLDGVCSGTVSEQELNAPVHPTNDCGTVNSSM